MPDSLTVSNLTLELGGNRILKGIDFAVKQGSIVALLGQSGSGKSTLLRAIAGLERPSQGEIALEGVPVYSSAAKIDRPPEKRNLGLVFQSYALWPHKTVAENIAYGLRLRKTKAEEREALVEKTLHSVELGHLGARFPHELSGGQQQRVALARAIVYDAPVVLLDEPLSNLDAKLRESARDWVRDIIKEKGLTGVFVTHDQTEAMAIADEVMLMNGGQIEQFGPPEALFEAPRTRFAAQFLGSNLTWRGRIESASPTRATVRVGGMVLSGELRGGPRSDGDEVDVVVRVRAVGFADGPGENRVEAELRSSVYLGREWESRFTAGGVEWKIVSRTKPGPERRWLCVDPADCWIF